jgi:cystathionine beta-lyase
VAESRGVGFVDAATLAGWLRDGTRTTYLLDVRTPDEFARGSAPAAVHAPGGQLVQSTDQWIGTRGARIVLLDDDGVRAPMTAQWLRQLGHEAHVLEGRVAAAAQISAPPVSALAIPRPATMSAAELAEKLRDGAVQVIDLRPSASFRKEHIAGAVWSIRPRIANAADATKTIVLVADDPEVAALAALDLTESGAREVKLLAGGQEAARTQGIAMASTPGTPADADRIDFLFFTAARHEGDEAAARQYLTWEIGLVDQLDAAERASFKIAGGP